MTLRDSLDLIKAVNPEGGYAVLEHEMMAERASSLGAAEARVAKTMAALNARSASSKSGNTFAVRKRNQTRTPAHDRPAALHEARQAVWAYFVQRELCGFRRHEDVIAQFSITPEVLNGLGASSR